MGLTLKEVRNPVPLVRAARLQAALEAHGEVNEYNAAGAISPNDGVALLRANAVGQAMTLADGTVPGETMLVRLLEIPAAGGTIVLTPTTFADGATMTFDAEGEQEVLIWVAVNGWTVRPGGSSTIA